MYKEKKNYIKKNYIKKNLKGVGRHYIKKKNTIKARIKELGIKLPIFVNYGIASISIILLTFLIYQDFLLYNLIVNNSDSVIIGTHPVSERYIYYPEEHYITIFVQHYPWYAYTYLGYYILGDIEVKFFYELLSKETEHLERLLYGPRLDNGYSFFFFEEITMSIVFNIIMIPILILLFLVLNEKNEIKGSYRASVINTIILLILFFSFICLINYLLIRLNTVEDSEYLQLYNNSYIKDVLLQEFYGYKEKNMVEAIRGNILEIFAENVLKTAIEAKVTYGEYYDMLGRVRVSAKNYKTSRGCPACAEMMTIFKDIETNTGIHYNVKLPFNLVDIYVTHYLTYIELELWRFHPKSIEIGNKFKYITEFLISLLPERDRIEANIDVNTIPYLEPYEYAKGKSITAIIRQWEGNPQRLYADNDILNKFYYKYEQRLDEISYEHKKVMEVPYIHRLYNRCIKIQKEINHLLFKIKICTINDRIPHRLGRKILTQLRMIAVIFHKQGLIFGEEGDSTYKRNLMCYIKNYYLEDKKLCEYGLQVKNWENQNVHCFNKKGTEYYSLQYSVDNLSIIFILLTNFLIIICIYNNFSLRYDGAKIKLYFICFMVLQILLTLTFLAENLIVFFICFESVLIPMFFIIGIWGIRRRKVKASYYLMFYTLMGSIFMLFIIMYISIEQADLGGNMNLSNLSLRNWGFNYEIIFFILFFISFAIKIPIVPFHLWLPEAHVEAPTMGSVILAGILLKLGGYGFIKILIPIFTKAAYFLTPYCFVLCLISVIYVSITTIRQIDLKKVIAYSSIAHMSFVVLGIFSFNLQGLSGSIFLMFSHGLVSSGLFLLIGSLYDKFHTRLIKYFSGLYLVMPIFSMIFFFLYYVI